MVVSNDKVVSVVYDLTLANDKNEVIEKVDDTNPLVFLLGRGNLLPKFESNLDGLNIGDSFDFVLISEDAYGKKSDEAIVELPKSIFEVEGQIDETLLTIGNMVPMMDQQGNHFNGKVLEIQSELVKMDFNHPLADKDLHFKGKVVDVRDATDEELMHGHIHKSSCGGCGSQSGCEGGCN